MAVFAAAVALSTSVFAFFGSRVWSTAFFAAVPQSATACLIRSKLAASALSCGKSLATESTVNVTFIFFVVRSQLAAYVYVIGSLLVSFAVLTRLAVSVASFWEEHATFSSASFAWPVRVFM